NPQFATPYASKGATLEELQGNWLVVGVSRTVCELAGPNPNQWLTSRLAVHFRRLRPRPVFRLRPLNGRWMCSLLLVLVFLGARPGSVGRLCLCRAPRSA